MPRKYKRKTENSSTDPIKVLEALKAVKIEQCCVKSVVQNYNIPGSSFSCYLTRINHAFSDISIISDQQLWIVLNPSHRVVQKGYVCLFLVDFNIFIANLSVLFKVFSPAEEEALIKYLLDANQLGLEMKRNELCRITVEFAKKIEAAYPESWNENEMASRDWYEAFMRRHRNLDGRSPEQMDQTIDPLFTMDTKRDLCRACLLNSDSVTISLLNHITEISDSPQKFTSQLSLAEMYTQCVGIEEDSQQHMLCEDCAQKLIEFHKFRRMCHVSHERSQTFCQTDETFCPAKFEIDDNKEAIFDEIYMQENQFEADDSELESAYIKDPDRMYNWNENETNEQLDIGEVEKFEPPEELQSQKSQQETMVESSDDIETQ